MTPRVNDAGRAQPEADRRFASVVGLGPLIKLYKSSAVAWWVNIVMTLAFITVTLGVIISGYPSSLNCLWIAFPMLAIAVWHTAAQRWAAALYEGGFAYHNWQGLRQIAWSEIRTLHEQWRWTGDEYSAAYTRFTHVETRTGQEVKLPGGLDELWGVVEQKAMEYALVEPLAALRSGRTLDFNPFSVSERGLELSRRRQVHFVEWRNVASVREKPIRSPDGMTEVEVVFNPDGSPAPQNWPPIRRDRIRNVSVLLGLCRHYIGDHIT